MYLLSGHFNVCEITCFSFQCDSMNFGLFAGNDQRKHGYGLRNN